MFRFAPLVPLLPLTSVVSFPATAHQTTRVSNSCTRRGATAKNQVWSYDFVSDQTDDGGVLKNLAIVDEYTRE